MRDPADDREGAPPTGEARGEDDARSRGERGDGVRSAGGADEARSAEDGGGGGLAERRWSLVAGLCLVAAAALWLLVGVDAAFFFATLGVLAWFWDQRNRIAARHLEAEKLTQANADDAEDDVNADDAEDDVNNEDGINNEDDLDDEDDPGGVAAGGRRATRR